MSWLSDIGSWISDNKSWLKPVAQVGLGALQQSQKDNAQQAYLDYLRQQENQNYQTSVTDINAYNSAMAANAAARSRAAGARAAAARATEANRQAAAKKANSYLQNTYKKLLSVYAPYRATADALLPQMQKTYESSLGLQNNLLQFVNSPQQQAKLNGSIPAWQVNVPLPPELRG